MKKILLMITALVLATCVSRADEVSSRPESLPNPVLRVCIIDGSPSLQLSIKGGYTITALDPSTVIMKDNSLDGKVFASQAGLVIGDKEIAASGVAVMVEKDSTIYVDGKSFRGEIDIIKKDNKKLMVINHIPVEEYLYGVLHYEVSDRWPIAALKAQAISARTFAIYQARQNKLQPYDLRSDIYSQVYGGSATEKWTTTKAVNLTRAKVLTYKGDIFPTYFHATCAGGTENASSLWNIDILPLKGVKCVYCLISPHYKWTKEIPLIQLEDNLRKGGYKLGKISSVGVLSRNKSGRVEKLEIKDNRGVTAVMMAKEFRQLIGPNEIKSTRFELSLKWGRLIIVGQGWGHGVGMCQWGAYGLSKKGRTAEEILKFYYPGSQITSLEKIKSKP
jgi:stage II sporulation protein D